MRAPKRQRITTIIDALQSHTHQPMLLVKRNVIASEAACTRTKAPLRVKKMTKYIIHKIVFLYI
jgi:hypothetical protein